MASRKQEPSLRADSTGMAQVHSAGADDEFGPGFELVEAVEYWEPPVEGMGPPENPVPAPDGTMFRSPAEANGNAAPADNGLLVSCACLLCRSGGCWTGSFPGTGRCRMPSLLQVAVVLHAGMQGLQTGGPEDRLNVQSAGLAQ